MGRKSTALKLLANVFKHLIMWYLAIFLPLGLISHTRAYVNFVHHRASAIPFEIMTAYGAHPTETLNWAWFWPPWELQTGFLWQVASQPVDIGDRGQAGVSLGYVVWGDSVASKETATERHFGTQSFEEIIWPLGGPVSGKTQLTLIGRGVAGWFDDLTESWDAALQRMVYSSVTVTRAHHYIYNRGNAWYVFTAHTSMNFTLQDNPELAKVVKKVARQPRPTNVSSELLLDAFPQLLNPEDDPAIMAALDELVRKAGLWQAGEQSRTLLLRSIRELDFRRAGLVPLHDSFLAVVLWTALLYLPTLPIRYLLFAPLTVLPYWLVAPLAYLYLATLLFFLWKCYSRWIPKKSLGTLFVVYLFYFLILFTVSSAG